MEAFKEIRPLFRKQRAVKEMVTGSFNFSITKAWIDSTPELMAKFMSIQVIKIKCRSV